MCRHFSRPPPTTTAVCRCDQRRHGNERKTKKTDFNALQAAIIKGSREEVVAIVTAAIREHADVNALLDKGMIPAMREIGDRFSRNEAYVPELLIAARAMQSGLALLDPLITASGRVSRGKVAIGTVKGDLHDIGKNLVAIMIKGGGYDVIDLGVNCDLDKFEEGVSQGATILACSSLLTTTMTYMRDVVDHFHGRGIKIIIGGAPVTQAYCDAIGADGYSEDANGAVKLVDAIFKASAG